MSADHEPDRSEEGGRPEFATRHPLWRTVTPDFQGQVSALNHVERLLNESTAAPLGELVRMKLEANRRIDQVHIEDLLRVGLIDADMAATLPADLLERLRYVRDTMEWFTPPPEF